MRPDVLRQRSENYQLPQLNAKLLRKNEKLFGIKKSTVKCQSTTRGSSNSDNFISIIGNATQ